ncbi:endonuclease VII domain-containing protein [Streptomyces sp. NBC_00464]|uniref:endonuclease domain-containing protein n=1 Tax=Streptomyces sp. NBC_00464 TaxID=2975751 RepID=UPI002E18DB58
MIGPTPWRVLYKPTDRRRERAALHPCTLADSERRCTPSELTAVNVMVWDHCHTHGYIRGPLCAQHNLRMRQYDEGWERYTGDPDFIEYARRCPGCSGPW